MSFDPLAHVIVLGVEFSHDFAAGDCPALSDQVCAVIRGGRLSWDEDWIREVATRFNPTTDQP